MTLARCIARGAALLAVGTLAGCGALDPDRYTFDTDVPRNDASVFPDAGQDIEDDLPSLDVGPPDIDAADVWDVDTREEDPPPPPPADLATVHAEVFVPACAACHIDGAQGGLSLVDDDGLSDRLFAESVQAPGVVRVVPGDLDASYLWLKIDGRHLDAGGAGEIMPIGGALTDTQRAILEEWITVGLLAD